jgi:hypothetical protein
VSGALAGVGASALSTHVIGIGSSGNVHGYQNGLFGSLSPTTYRDKGGNVRTITVISWNDDVDTLALRITTSPGDSNTTFTAIELKGQRFTRASAVFSDLGGGVHQWAWTGVTANPIGTSGSVLLYTQ